MRRLKCGILGATGAVGQRFVQLLSRHPDFIITSLYASERSAGKRYGERRWMLEGDVPEGVKEMEVVTNTLDLDADIIFSALPGGLAKELERDFARRGYVVCSNTRDNRMEPDVPLVIPEINPEHLEMVKGRKGFVVTNPNCSTIVMCLALKPLEKFGIEAVNVTTLQALSGAGYPGVASLDILGNVLPYINGEEEKMESEPLKIFGRFRSGEIQNAQFKISASCTRVPVVEGHTISMQVKLSDAPSIEEVKEAYTGFEGLPQKLSLPSAPNPPIVIREEEDRPQPRRDLGDGMGVTVGRVRKDEVLGYKLFAMGSNTIRGAAGASILNAELLAALGYI
jgi:aspartate-semialdehyde dehydrogenase